MLINSVLPLRSKPDKMVFDDHLSFQDLKQIALTGKEGKIVADSLLDFFAKQILCVGQTREERKAELVKLYKAVSPNFIRAINHDIDQLNNQIFTEGFVTVEFGKKTDSPFFLMKFASLMVDQVSDCKEIANEYKETILTDDGDETIRMLDYYYPPNVGLSGIMAEGSTGITIRQTPSNSISNKISTKLLEALKKASILFFNKLYDGCKISELDKDSILPHSEELEKYENKYVLSTNEMDKGNLRDFTSAHAIIWLLQKSQLLDKVDLTPLGVSGEKADIQKFMTLLYAQQFPDTTPSKETLKKARCIKIS